MANFWNTKFGNALKGAGKWTLNALDELSIPVLSQVASMATGILGSNWKKNTVDDRMSGAEREAFNLNAQEAQKVRDWNLEMDNTKYQRQVTDMQKAGINPALAMNGGVTTQATSNATGNASSQQASIMPIQDFATLAAALKTAEADQDQKKASADLDKERERGERIQNDANAVTLLEKQIADLKLAREQGEKTEEEKRKISKEIEVLEEEKKLKIQQQTLNTDQHEINEYAKKKMAVELEYLPQQIRAGLALNWAQEGFTKTQTDLKIAELESWDWSQRQVVSYSYARSIGANIHFNLFKNIVNPGASGGGEGQGQGIGADFNRGLTDSTQGLLIYDRKTKQFQFIPTFGYFEDAKDQRDKEEKEKRQKEKEARKAEKKSKK